MNEHKPIVNKISAWLRRYMTVDEIIEDNTRFEVKLRSGEQMVIAEIMKSQQPTVRFYMPKSEVDKIIPLDEIILFRENLVKLYSKEQPNEKD